MSDTVTIDAGGRGVEVSHAGKVFFPEAGLTKADIAGHYARVAELMLPHTRGRPLVMQRMPDGLEGEGFLQKNVPGYFPGWVRTATVAKEDGTITHVLADDAATLVYLADQGCLTPHLWLSRADRPARPDLVLVDLDPAGEAAADLAVVPWAARQVRRLLADVGLRGYVKLTGSRGVHVVVPVERRQDFDTTRGFARDLAGVLASRHPDRLTTAVGKQERRGRLFLDTGRNAYAQHAAAPYAVRARPGAPVAVPVEWDELDGNFGPRRWSVPAVARRIGSIPDPWSDLPSDHQRLGPARKVLDEIRSGEAG